MEIDWRKYIRKKTVSELVSELDENNNFDDFINNPLIKTKSIKEYFNNSNIFVTGASGFLGKVLIEKLLRSCVGISKIYILLRPKRGLGSDQRFKEFLKNKIFDRIHEKTPEVLNKLICIPGEINEPNIGLTEKDSITLQDRIDIVFHVAATVRFNEPLRDAANLNTFGTQRVMELCTKMKNLKSLVHVSTAYSNPYLRNVDEQVYGSTSDEEHQMFINGVGVLPDEFINTIADRFQRKHPNTYTLTKHMAEHIVLDYHEKLPICIVRPSIVTAAINEPYPGWIDNIYGITGIIMEIGRGTLKSIVGDPKLILDITPVDIVSNTIITAAWANSFTRTNTVPVYNCTSGQINPIKLSEIVDKTVQMSRRTPSKYVMMLPATTFRTNILVHLWFELLFHFLPAFVFDMILIMQRKKPMMVKLTKRFKLARDTGSYFVLNEWNFVTRNFRRLMKTARETQLDAHEFNCDMSNINWDSYFEKYVLGIRTRILKDDIDSIPKAREKLQRIIWIRRTFHCFLLIAFCIALFNGLWQ